MTRVHHLNCGTLHAPPHPAAACHCLLLEDAAGLALVDTGIGRLDVRDPLGRIGQPLIDLAGFQFHENQTAARRVEDLGFRPAAVTDVVLTHADPDHTGGLADFPRARVHLSAEELANIARGNGRYLPGHFAHGVHWQAYPAAPGADRWFGLEARRVELGFAAEVLVVSALTAARADDNARRVESLNHLRRLARDHADAVTLFGYHDFGEFPPAP